jgi:hypothetical protein
MKRVLAMVALGIGGFVAAIGLTVGALALTGDDTATVVQPRLTESRSSSATPSREDRDGATPSPSADDHGGSGSDDSGSDDHGGSGSDDSGSDDRSGPGSGSDDNSGSGSSGSGSDDSGSGDVDDD